MDEEKMRRRRRKSLWEEGKDGLDFKVGRFMR